MVIKLFHVAVLKIQYLLISMLRCVSCDKCGGKAAETEAMAIFM